MRVQILANLADVRGWGYGGTVTDKWGPNRKRGAVFILLILKAVFKPSQASGSLVADAGLRGPGTGMQSVATNLGFLLWADRW